MDEPEFDSTIARKRTIGKIGEDVARRQSQDLLDREKREALLRRSVELVRTNPNISFIAAGIGNVSGVPRGDTSGIHKYIFDRTQQEMVDILHLETFEGKSLKSFEDYANIAPDSLFAGDGINPQVRKGLYALKGAKEVFMGHTYYVLKINFQGQQKGTNRFSEDWRAGHLNFGIRVPTDEKALDQLGEGIKKKFNDGKGDDDQWFIQDLAKMCAKEFIPDYYRFVNELKRRHEEKQSLQTPQV